MVHAMSNKKKQKKTNKTIHNVDTLSKAVKDISASRKCEIEEDPELTQALCGLADYVGNMFLKMLNDTLKNEDAEDKKKDMLLVLQLTYLKMCSDILGAEGNIEIGGNIPITGYERPKPIDNKKDNVPLYY